MSSEPRLVELWKAAGGAGHCLVIGFHAARFHGVLTTENADHSLYVDAQGEARSALQARLNEPWLALPASADRSASELVWPVPGAPEESFRLVFESGLMPSFDQAFQARRSGRYGDEVYDFLCVDHLLQSLESTRESDWRLLGELERVADETRLEACEDRETLVAALSNMRSVQGFERAHALGYYNDAEAVAEAVRRVTHPVSQAFLFPFQANPAIGERVQISPTVRTLLEGPLRHAEPGSVRQLGLIEAVRRAYRLSKMAASG